MAEDTQPAVGVTSETFTLLDPGAPQGQTPISEISPGSATHSLYERVRTSVVTGSHDALDILSDAARCLPPPGPSASSQPQSAINPIPAHQRARPQVQPGSFHGLGFTITSLSRPDEATLDFWDKCRFVRQGWFTAQEAVTYIDLSVRAEITTWTAY